MLCRYLMKRRFMCSIEVGNSLSHGVTGSEGAESPPIRGTVFAA